MSEDKAKPAPPQSSGQPPVKSEPPPAKPKAPVAFKTEGLNLDDRPRKGREDG
jgi:hypothetical protein